MDDVSPSRVDTSSSAVAWAPQSGKLIPGVHQCTDEELTARYECDPELARLADLSGADGCTPFGGYPSPAAGAPSAGELAEEDYAEWCAVQSTPDAELATGPDALASSRLRLRRTTIGFETGSGPRRGGRKARGDEPLRDDDARRPISVRRLRFLDRIAELHHFIDQANAEILELTAEEARVTQERAVTSTSTRPTTTGTTTTGSGVPSVLKSAVDRRVLCAEIALELQIGERAAQNLLGRALLLHTAFSRTRHALHNGDVGTRHAELIVDVGAPLDDHLTPQYEDAALQLAQTVPVTSFRRHLIALRNRLDPHSLTRRHHDAIARRRVDTAPDHDGMAWLTAYLPAEHIHVIDARLTAIAHHHRATGVSTGATNTAEAGSAGSLGGVDPRTGEVPTLAQTRADAFTDLLLRDENGDTAIRPTLYITVPVATLLGDDTPAELHGYGPIDPVTARRLTACAPTFHRILTTPDNTTILQVGTRTRHVPTDLKNWLRLRDGTCRFPNCSRPATTCDIDHTIDHAAGGPTHHTNLAHLCRNHHTLKHHANWRASQHPDGTLTWTSPHGRQHTTIPQRTLPTPGKSAPPPGLPTPGLGDPLGALPFEGVGDLQIRGSDPATEVTEVASTVPLKDGMPAPTVKGIAAGRRASRSSFRAIDHASRRVDSPNDPQGDPPF